MKSLRSFGGSTIQCIQPSIWRLEYEVRTGAEVIGYIRFPKAFSRKAEAESMDGHWMLEDKGIFKNKLTISGFNDAAPVAKFVFQAFGENKIRLSETKVLRFKRDFWKREYALTTDMNLPLLKIKERMGLKGEFDLIVDRRAETVPEFPWLFFLALYIAISNRRSRGAH